MKFNIITLKIDPADKRLLEFLLQKRKKSMILKIFDVGADADIS